MPNIVMPSFSVLWDNYVSGPCLNEDGEKPSYATNQCAISIGACLLRSGVDLRRYKNNPLVFCWEPGHENEQHILKAEELAGFLKEEYREPTVLRGQDAVNYQDGLSSQDGIVFFKDYWTREGASSADGDHIDLWQGSGWFDSTRTKSWLTESFTGRDRATEIWFWELS